MYRSVASITFIICWPSLLSLPKRVILSHMPSDPISKSSHCSPFHPLIISTFSHNEFAFSRDRYKWNMLSVFLLTASCHPVRIAFLYGDLSHFIYPLMDWLRSGLHLLATVKNGAMNTGLQIALRHSNGVTWYSGQKMFQHRVKLNVNSGLFN